MEFEFEVFLEKKINHTTLIKTKSSIDSTLIKKKVPALFLDRDGVIIQDCNYIKCPEDVKIMEGASLLINFFKRIGWRVIIISNQSGISRGYFKWIDYEKVNLKMIELLDLNNGIDAIYANGNGPESNCDCWRKPNPQMLIEASKRFNINLQKSILIGDRISDILAGNNAGLNSLFHVLTGHGKDERDKVIKFSDDLIRENSNQIKKNKSKNCEKQIILLKNLLEFDYSNYIFYN